MSEKDCVTGGLGELFDAGSDVDGVLLKGLLPARWPGGLLVYRSAPRFCSWSSCHGRKRKRVIGRRPHSKKCIGPIRSWMRRRAERRAHAADRQRWRRRPHDGALLGWMPRLPGGIRSVPVTYCRRYLLPGRVETGAAADGTVSKRRWRRVGEASSSVRVVYWVGSTGSRRRMRLRVRRAATSAPVFGP